MTKVYENPELLQKKRLLELADRIERSKTYNQGNYYNPDSFEHYPDCHTPACIAGHAAFMSVNEDPEVYSVINSRSIHEEFAIAWLGLSNVEADALFHGDPLDAYEKEGYALSYTGAKPTNKHAAAVLRNFARTKVVDWLNTISESDAENYRAQIKMKDVG